MDPSTLTERMTETLTCAIIGHLVGDYLLQNDWMANNKKKRVLPLTVHVTLWAFAVLSFSGWWALEHPKFLLVVVLLCLTHSIQDGTQIIMWWMRLKWKDQTKFTEPPMSPWSIIVVDNVWHIVTIWAIWKFIV